MEGRLKHLVSTLRQGDPDEANWLTTDPVTGSVPVNDSVIKKKKFGSDAALIWSHLIAPA